MVFVSCILSVCLLCGGRIKIVKDRLWRLHLPSLELRRLHVDLVWWYKILFSIVETPTEDLFVPCMYVSTRGHQYKLFKKPHVSRTRANFFSERIVNAWNFLPDIDDFSSLSRFKRSIHKVDFSRFVKCFYGAFMICILYFVHLVYFVYLCFFLKGRYKSLSWAWCILFRVHVFIFALYCRPYLCFWTNKWWWWWQFISYGRMNINTVTAVAQVSIIWLHACTHAQIGLCPHSSSVAQSIMPWSMPRATFSNCCFTSSTLYTHGW